MQQRRRAWLSLALLVLLVWLVDHPTCTWGQELEQGHGQPIGLLRSRRLLASPSSRRLFEAGEDAHQVLADAKKFASSQLGAQTSG